VLQFAHRLCKALHKAPGRTAATAANRPLQAAEPADVPWKINLAQLSTPSQRVCVLCAFLTAPRPSRAEQSFCVETQNCLKKTSKLRRKPTARYSRCAHSLGSELLDLPHSSRCALLEGYAIQPLVEVDGDLTSDELSDLLVLGHLIC
jgi:hypothetical protein